MDWAECFDRGLTRLITQLCAIAPNNSFKPKPLPARLNSALDAYDWRSHRANVRHPVRTTDWSKVDRTEHQGESGLAYWRTQQFGNIRVRMVEYTPGYRADHWCVKGHILLCTEGELHTELEDGRTFTLVSGMSYQVADRAEPHRSYTDVGATLFIVD